MQFRQEKSGRLCERQGTFSVRARAVRALGSQCSQVLELDLDFLQVLLDLPTQQATQQRRSECKPHILQHAPQTLSYGNCRDSGSGGRTCAFPANFAFCASFTSATCPLSILS